MAEGVFRSLVGSDSPYHNLIDKVDSCGTGAYHEGDPPDERTMGMLRSHGITNYTHEARQVSVLRHALDPDLSTYPSIAQPD
jgi:low molecular weight phosphotyrosine protein phosphatase